LYFSVPTTLGENLEALVFLCRAGWIMIMQSRWFNPQTLTSRIKWSVGRHSVSVDEEVAEKQEIGEVPAECFSNKRGCGSILDYPLPVPYYSYYWLMKHVERKFVVP